MSNPSEFVIIREEVNNKIIASDEEFLKAREYNGLIHDSFHNKDYEIKDLPEYFSLDRFHKINRDTKQVFDKIMTVEFNSIFSCLKDEYNLSAYSNNNLHEISFIEACKMLEAINYLLLEHYDKTLESDVLDNKFIDLFAENYSAHYNFLVGDEKDDEGNSLKMNLSDQEYEEERFILKRIKVVLDAFVTLIDEDNWNGINYKLLYIAC